MRGSLSVKRIFWIGLAFLGLVSSLVYLYRIIPSLPEVQTESHFARHYRRKAEYEASVFATIDAMRVRPISWSRDKRTSFLDGPRPRRVRIIPLDPILQKSEETEEAAALAKFVPFAIDFALFHMDHIVPITSVRGDASRGFEIVSDLPGGSTSAPIRDCSMACAFNEFDPLEDIDVCFVDESRTKKFPKNSFDQAIVLMYLVKGEGNMRNGDFYCALSPVRSNDKGMANLLIYDLSFSLDRSKESFQHVPCDLGSHVIKIVRESNRLDALVESILRKSSSVMSGFSPEHFENYLVRMREVLSARRRALLEALETDCNPMDELADVYNERMTL